MRIQLYQGIVSTLSNFDQISAGTLTFLMMLVITDIETFKTMLLEQILLLIPVSQLIFDMKSPLSQEVFTRVTKGTLISTRSSLVAYLYHTYIKHKSGLF